MTNKNIRGTTGAGGTKASPGGGAGGNASYVNIGNGTDATNYTDVGGGYGGGGYPGGGNGGAGGYAAAVTHPSPTVNTVNPVYSKTTAYGGNGGNGALPTDPFLGGAATGGAGGNGYALSYAANSLGLARSAAIVRGGAGGESIGIGAVGGAAGTATIGTTSGGIATIGTVVAKGDTTAIARATQQGGSGGGGIYGANGANGASSTLNNQVSGSAPNGRMTLTQYADGGGGGFSNGGVVGKAGYGKSYLTFDDNTTNPTPANYLYGNSDAEGGTGAGYLGPGVITSAGGAATASIDLTGAHFVQANVRAIGNTAGSAANFGMVAPADANGGAGGAATVTQAKATSTSTTAKGAYASATAEGGAGGLGAGSGKTGGAGGAAVVAPVYASGHSASASAYQRGGSGGNGVGGASGGNGVASYLLNDVSGETSGGTLYLKETAKGGYGGISYGGVAGKGATGSASLTTNDYLINGTSVNPTPAETLRGGTYAYGGGGGSGMLTTQGVAGAAATAYTKFTGAHVVNARAVTRGGMGGQSGPGLTGAIGGTGTATAEARSDTKGSDNAIAGAQVTGGAGGAAYGTGGDGGTGGAAIGAGGYGYAQTATGGYSEGEATQTGGAGGGGRGSGNTGGMGGAATKTYALAIGFNVKAIVTQTGGGGGGGDAALVNGVVNENGVGANGGAGASSTLKNDVAGATFGGFMYLEQTAVGGGGGGAYGNGGAGGNANSQLTFDDTINHEDLNTWVESDKLRGESYADGGTSGAGGLFGNTPATSAPNGGHAYASLHLTGGHAVYAKNASADGGGGSSVFSGSINGGVGGYASAEAVAKSTTTASDRVGAYANSYGGGGGKVDGGTGSGGAGGNSNPTYALSYALTATGGLASAGVKQIGGAGGEAFGAGGAGQSGGAGGQVYQSANPDRVYAEAQAFGFNADASVQQTGGIGGNATNGANGGAGANSGLYSAAYGKAKGGYLILTQSATGGGGGYSNGGTAGAAGTGYSYLGFNDATTSKVTTGTASTIKGYSDAAGGQGGAGLGTSNGAVGGMATSKADLAGAKSVTAVVNAAGGEGGAGQGTGSAGNGGTASGTATATSTTSGNNPASATVNVRGGTGGGIAVGHTGNGGTGGAATGATATATTGQLGEAVAEAIQIGGGGGRAMGAGHQGGNGATASGTTATATGYSATVITKQTGGYGGNGTVGANAGQGVASSLKNAVTGIAYAGPLSLTQTATGGAGGGTNAGVAGLGAEGYSYLKSSDVAQPGAAPRSVTATINGYGGAGGYGTGGSDGGAGGKGSATVNLTGLNDVTATADAKGGAGGTSTITAGSGGYAISVATGTATGTGLIGTATVTAAATGGTGAPQGNANANATASTAAGQLAQATALADGPVAIAQTSANTSDTGTLLGVTANTSETASGSLTLSSSAEINGITPQLDGANDYAFADGLPGSIFINNTMASNSAINAVLGSADTAATILGFGVQGGAAEAQASGSQVVTTTEVFTVNASDLSGDFYLGLVGNQALGTVGSVAFTAFVGGTEEVNKNFTSVSAAQGYFDDNPVSLGAVPSVEPVGGLAVTLTLTVTASTANSAFGESFLLGTTGVNGPPVIGVADPTFVIGQGLTTKISGLSLSEVGNTTGEGFTVKLTDTNGLLSASGAGGAIITDSNTTALTISGSVTQVNAALATVTDTSTTDGADTVDLNATDTLDGVATQQSVGVTVNGLPTLSVPSSVSVKQSTALTIGTGFSIAETGNTTGETFTVKLTDTNGLLSAGTGLGATVSGNNSTSLTISGSLINVNNTLLTLADDDSVSPSDSIVVKATDSLGNAASQQSAPVTVAGSPSLAVPTGTQTVGEIGSTLIPGVSVSETGAGVNEQFVVVVSDKNGILSASGAGGATVTNQGELQVTISGTLPQVNAALETLSDTEAQINFTQLSPDTITVSATDGFDVATGSKTIAVQVYDTVAAIEGLTPTEIATLVGNSITTVRTIGEVFVSATLAHELVAAGINIEAGFVVVQDSAAAIEGLTQTDFSHLASIGVNEIQSNTTTVSLNFGQATSLASAPVPIVTPTNQVVVTATASQIEGLQTSDIAHLQTIGVTDLTATDTSVDLGTSEAEALAATPTIRVTPPAGDSVIIQDLPATLELLSTSAFGQFNAIGATLVTSKAGSFTLSVAQAEATVSTIMVDAPAGSTVSIADTPGNIEGLLAINSGQEMGNVEFYDNVTSLAANGSVALTVAEAEAAENPGGFPSVTISAPIGDTVTLADNAGAIMDMTAAQLGGLSAIGVTGVTVLDESLTLTVAQALALFDPIPITVPAGDTVTIMDSEANVDALTPSEVAGLAAIGVNAIDVPSLTGAGPITIEGGITLSVAGAISSAQTITFAGTGGTLALADPVDMAGTVAGFAVPDTIDLTGGAFDGSATANLGANNLLTVSENSGSYNIQLDQAQFFPNANFVPTQDAGTGTNVNIVMLPITSYIAVPSGQYVDGALIASGGYVDVQNGATLNAGTIDAGGLLQFEPGAAGDGVVTLGEGGTVNVSSEITLGDGLVVVDQPSDFTGTIQNFNDDTTLYLPNETVTNPQYNGTAITFTDGSDTLVTLDATGGLSVGALSEVTDGHGGFYIGSSSDPGVQPCFAAGTRISTQRGEIAVEDLLIGDVVQVVDDAGAALPITWIGYRTVNCERHPEPRKVWPVRVSAGAFGINRPCRDLLLSPDHSVFVGDVLIPVKHLINGSTIAQVPVREVTYYHVQLPRHAVLLSEALPTESYLDTGDRSNFANGGGPIALHPDFASRVWDAEGCAPVIVTGPELDAARRWVNQLAVMPARELRLARSA